MTNITMEEMVQTTNDMMVTISKLREDLNTLAEIVLILTSKYNSLTNNPQSMPPDRFN